ncbi:thioredoxin family protein [Acetobacterium woodii]|uniref:Putative thioredoxin n=1 Tax=Acetobacterium woodii (strain ATCC 29683 / DSM 1030 / JCM 2381 / KCTC 1655 / WB1) TaxID=931626 RepID=H6LKB0_ACEWD|nr:thioredoxin family protein [Acetobacterium woodii]AFA50030.1 putative thioredoxin [Acetobacterium woodii DSM 1030]
MELVNSGLEMDELKKKHDMILIYFGSETCSVCRDMKPKIVRMIEKYPKIKAVNIDVQKMTELSASYRVFTAPAIILFIQGKETIREAGIISIIRLEDAISRYDALFYGDEN